MAGVFHPSPVDGKASQEEDGSSNRLSVQRKPSTDAPPSFTHERDAQGHWRERSQSRPDSPSYMSMKTERSMEPPRNFSGESPRTLRPQDSEVGTLNSHR